MDEKINAFKNTIHYRDICYFIDHIESQDVFNSCMEELGYSTGLLLLSDQDSTELKSVFMGERGEIRILSFLIQDSSLAECVIYKSND